MARPRSRIIGCLLSDGFGMVSRTAGLLRVRMEGVFKQLALRCYLSYLAQVHDADTVAHVVDRAQVVGDEEVCQPELPLELVQHVEDLALDGDVQG